MSRSRRQDLLELSEMTDRLAVRSVASLEEGLALLPEEGELWGFLTTPAAARLGRHATAEWRRFLADPRLQEVRVFDQRLDFHWLGESGVCLRQADGDAPAIEIVAGAGWWQRQRESRLWGEVLVEKEVWYEERIPGPQRYHGLSPTLANRFAFLVYREYVHRGAVRWVRYLEVKGAAR